MLDSKERLETLNRKIFEKEYYKHNISALVVTVETYSYMREMNFLDIRQYVISELPFGKYLGYEVIVGRDPENDYVLLRGDDDRF